MQIIEGFESLHSKVVEYEKTEIFRGKNLDISYNDVHIIATVGIGEPKNMSAIAKELSVTVGSLTTAMNGLVKKEYVYRERCAADRRVVYIRLTQKGREIFEQHTRIMNDIASQICDLFADSQKQSVVEMLEKANDFMEKR